jgi:hypothetical protein
MTEAEWLASTDVSAMYVFLRDTTTLFKTRSQGDWVVPRFAFSERKSRLFAVACCRRILHLMPTDEARHCVLAAEQYADGLIGGGELNAAIDALMRSCSQHSQYIDRLTGRGGFWRYEIEALNAVGQVHRPEAGGRMGVIRAAATAWAWAAAVNQNLEGEDAGRALVQAEYARQADLLRDIVGNPFHLHNIDPAWLAWNDCCIERLTRGVYEDRAFDRLPILHDALLDAGCDDEAMLAHCRTGEGHVRGCWVVDALLGKE